MQRKPLRQLPAPVMEARTAKRPFPEAAELSKRLISEARQTAERSFFASLG